VAPGFGVVVGQELGLGGDGLWKPGFEQLRRLLVVLLPGAFQQGGIGGILDERMLEEVAGAGRPAPLISVTGVICERGARAARTPDDLKRAKTLSLPSKLNATPNLSENPTFAKNRSGPIWSSRSYICTGIKLPSPTCR
jgi:hypothetical protein